MAPIINHYVKIVRQRIVITNFFLITNVYPASTAFKLLTVGIYIKSVNLRIREVILPHFETIPRFNTNFQYPLN